VVVLVVGGRDAAVVLIKASVVEPVDPFGGGDLDGVQGAPRRWGSISPVLYSPLTVSASVIETVADRPDGGRDAPSARRPV
jgi:hypothetical protein